MNPINPTNSINEIKHMSEILRIVNLRACLHTSHGVTKAVDGIDLGIAKGEVFGLVGESGSGKSMTALSILKLLPRQGRIAGGEIIFKGRDIVGMDEEALRAIRGNAISIVFQEPASALDPVFTVGDQLDEALRAHQELVRPRERRAIVLNHLKKAHIDEALRVYHSFPHQLSGGTKQRVMIAMALLNSPELLILDEPTTALDVTIQSQILDLLEEIIEEEALSILFISHDFGVIARMCDRVGVMHRGKIVETGRTSEIINSPKEEYTQELLESVRALS